MCKTFANHALEKKKSYGTKKKKKKPIKNCFYSSQRLLTNIESLAYSNINDIDRVECKKTFFMSERKLERDPSGRFEKTSQLLLSYSDGKVHRYIYKAFDSETANEVAWVEYRNVPRSIINSAQVQERVASLVNLNHEYMVKYHKAWVWSKRKRVVFITEYNGSGNLRRYLSVRGAIGFGPSVYKSWAKQILLGLEYMHSCAPPLIHCDLSCAHVMIQASSGTVKIGGLGLSTFITELPPALLDVTPGFSPADSADGNFYFDVKSDIYGFGMCLLQMLTLEYPYIECRTASAIWFKQYNGQLPETLSRVTDADARDVIQRCLQPVGMRPSARELISHPYFSDVPTSSVANPPLPVVDMLEPEIVDFVVPPSAAELVELATKHDAIAASSSSSAAAAAAPSASVPSPSPAPAAPTTTSKEALQVTLDIDAVDGDADEKQPLSARRRHKRTTRRAVARRGDDDVGGGADAVVLDAAAVVKRASAPTPPHSCKAYFPGTDVDAIGDSGTSFARAHPRNQLCVRIMYDSLESMQQLLHTLVELLALASRIPVSVEPQAITLDVVWSHFQLFYLDVDNDLVLVTSHTTIDELMRYAKSLHIFAVQ
jgi:serine/threonine protein kinase